MDQVDYSAPLQIQENNHQKSIVYIVAIIILLLVLAGLAIFTYMEFNKNQTLQGEVQSLKSSISSKDTTIQALNKDLEDLKNRADIVSYLFTQSLEPTVSPPTLIFELQKKVEALNDPVATEKLNKMIESRGLNTQDFLWYFIQGLSK